MTDTAFPRPFDFPWKPIGILGILLGLWLAFSTAISNSFSIDVIDNTSCDCGSVDPNAPCEGTQASYTLDGSTIEFNFSCPAGDCYCGQFADERSFWVAPQTPGNTVTVTSMTPAATGVGTTSVKNGAQADAFRMIGQGFTEKITGAKLADVDTSLTISTPYDVNAASIGRPTVILKSISAAASDCGTSTRICLEHVETLTVLDEPPGDVFRPPFYGTEKPMIAASNFDDSFLSDLAPVSGNITWAEAVSRTAGVSVREYISNWNAREGMTANSNNQSEGGYEGYVNLTENEALIKLTESTANQTEADQKTQLAKNIAQRGIDLYYIHKNGGNEDWGGVSATSIPCGAWVGTGGYGSGKLVPIVFASELLNQGSWRTVLNANIGSHDGRQCFAETGFVQPAMGVGKNLPLFGHLITSLYTVNCIDQNRNCADIGGGTNAILANYEGDTDGDSLNPATGSPANYQSIQTGPWLGSAMAVWATPRIRNVFPSGATHWLGYVERSRDTGITVGADFGAYTSKTDYTVTGDNSAYDRQHFYNMYTTYKSCSDAGNCTGLGTP